MRDEGRSVYADREMPRQQNPDVSGALHRIMLRGINKASLFEDDENKTNLMKESSEEAPVRLRLSSRREGRLLIAASARLRMQLGI
jgi:hypothetical protein